MYKQYEELPLTLTPADIMEILKISKNTAYTLCNSKDFPTIKVGKLIRIRKDKFFEWLENTEHNKVY